MTREFVLRPKRREGKRKKEAEMSKKRAFLGAKNLV
jgi:hypothetical protein